MQQTSPHSSPESRASDTPTPEPSSAPSAPDSGTPGRLPVPGLRAAVTWLTNESDPHAAGARVVEPPRDTKQAIRGNLYLVAQVEGTPSDGDPESAGLCERMLSMAQRTYYTARGSQSAVLGEALRAALRVVQQNNAVSGSSLRVSMAGASLLHGRLTAGCVGAAFLLLRLGDQVELYPTTPDALHSADPATIDDVQVLRWEMGPEDALMLCGPGWLDRLTLKMLAAVVYHVTPGSAEEFAEGLREQAGGAVAPGLLLALEEEGPLPPPRPATPLTAPRRAAGSLPTALGAAPPFSAPSAPVAMTPPAGELHALDAAGEPGLWSSAAGAAQAGAAAAGGPAADAHSADTADQSDPDEEITPEMVAPSTADRVRHGLQAGAGVGLVKARSFFRQMLPEKRADADLEGEDEFALRDFDELAPATRVPGSEGPETGATEARLQPFAPPPPASGGRARLFITISLLIALLVPVIVAAYYWQLDAVNRAEAESLLTLAQARVASAQTALDANDSRSALGLLSEAQAYLDRMAELVGGTTASSELQAVIRELEADAAQVQRLYALTSPLVTLPGDAAATRVLVVDQDIYILDPGRGVVERYRMDQSLDNVPDPTGVPVLRAGDAISTTTVGTPRDIAWQPVIPGYDDKATLLVLDDKNQIFRYDPRVEGPSLMSLKGREAFGELTQVESFTGRLYMADAGQGQLLRYPAGRFWEVPPDNWFAAPLTLDEMISLRIDGDIWMLMRTGQVLRFSAGEQVAFSLDNSVGLMREPVDFFVGDGTNPYIYVADGGGERVWVFDRDGQYVKQLAAPEGNPLRGLSGIFIEDVTDSLYLLTSTALYKHPLPQE